MRSYGVVELRRTTPTTRYPLVSKNSARYEPSWPVIPVMSAVFTGAKKGSRPGQLPPARDEGCEKGDEKAWVTPCSSLVSHRSSHGLAARRSLNLAGREATRAHRNPD